jgi:uncharacterized phiE125 gp8 family phage protein
MSLRLVTPPTETPVTLQQEKAHLRVDFNDEDDTIATLIAAATRAVENRVQRRYCTQTVEWVVQNFPMCGLRLPLAPVASVGSIKYTNANGSVSTLDPSAYIVTSQGEATVIYPALGSIWPLAWPGAKPVAVIFTAGGAAADVEAHVRAAILLMVGHLYQNREAVVQPQGGNPAELPLGVADLMLAEAWD